MSSTTLVRGNIQQVKMFATSLTPSSVLPNITAEQTFTIQGVAVGDYISCNSVAAQTAGIGIVGCRVTATNTVGILFGNFTAGALTPVAGSYGFSWERSENSPLPTDAT